MADETNPQGQKLKAALEELTEHGVRRSNNRLKETSTMRKNFVYVGMYSITPMLLLLYLMICRSRSQ